MGSPSLLETAKLLVLYEGVMGTLEHSESGRYALRIWDGMDGCWSNVQEGRLHEVLQLWSESTVRGTSKTRFDEIDYYKVFPAETRMKWDGSEGREMFRGGEEP